MATLEETLDKAIEVAVKRAILKAHPVGSLYLSLTDENPSISLGGGTWVKVGSGKCLWGADSSHAVGTEISAGLPNITGKIQGTGEYGGVMCIDPAFSGSLSGTQQGNSAWDGSHKGAYHITFDASKSNSIYGNSSTVQPPALAVNIWRRTA